MKKTIRATVASVVAAALVATVMPTVANAGGKDAALGFLGGLFVGGAIANSQQGGYTYVAPVYQAQPVYVQPRVCYRKEKYFDPYAGWVWRTVQYYC